MKLYFIWKSALETQFGAFFRFSLKWGHVVPIYSKSWYKSLYKADFCAYPEYKSRFCLQWILSLLLIEFQFYVKFTCFYSFFTFISCFIHIQIMFKDCESIIVLCIDIVNSYTVNRYSKTSHWVFLADFEPFRVALYRRNRSIAIIHSVFGPHMSLMYQTKIPHELDPTVHVQ